MMKTFKSYLVSILLLLAAWKGLSLALAPNILPPPETVFRAFGDAVKTENFWGHFGVSAYRIILAMAAGWLVAFPLGLFIGYNRIADRFLSPLVFLTYPVPKIVLLPVFLMMFGLGDASKIIMIALITGYQILVASRDSVLGLDKKYLDSFRSIGGNHVQTIRHVIVPAALPNGFTALRIGSGTGIAVLFFVESFATTRGLGFFIMDSWGRADTESMFVGIIGMSILGVTLYETFNYLEKNLCAWKLLETRRPEPHIPRSDVTGPVIQFGRMIKFSHTLFALPFALSAVILAARQGGLSIGLFFWITAAVAGARSAAVGFNRIVDARIDADNPRTADRAIPAGHLSMKTAAGFVILFSLVFIIAAAMISRLCFILSFPVLAVLFLHSYTKRFTFFSHLYLGFAMSLAPLGAWIAVAGDFDWRVLTLSFALLTYIAGFDILYACQDLEYDREKGLFSIPAMFGVKVAFHISTVFHLLSFLGFFSVYLVFDLGGVFLGALLVIGGLMVLEHKLFSPYDPAEIKTSFFNINSAIPIVFFLGVLGDQALRWLG